VAAQEEDRNAQASRLEREANEHSLDTLAKALAGNGVTRRKALRLFGGALVGSLLASIPGTALAQQRRPTGERGCPEGLTRCPGRPLSGHGGSPQELTAGGCTYLQIDDFNCGACGNVCPGDSLCVEGRCVSNQEFCAQFGVDLTTTGNYCIRREGVTAICCADPEECCCTETSPSSCQCCPSGQRCVHDTGQCVPEPECAPGEVRCNPDLCCPEECECAGAELLCLCP
jgi:hypothetical protein